MNNENMLFVIWKSRDDGKKYTIGKLFKDKKYYFEYIKEELELAKEKGFNGIFSFPDYDKNYESKDMFSVFLTRLPSINREDIRDILVEYDLEEYDAFELLKKTKGKVMTDNLEFVTAKGLQKIKQTNTHKLRRDR